MAFIQTEIAVSELGRSLMVDLYYPTDLSMEVGNKVKGVITLLHGLYGTYSNWMNFTAAPRYAADNGYILVCPQADNSFYHDMVFGPAFFTGLSEFLPQRLREVYNIPAEREMNYIAGLSMGGYGALRLGLSHPERYAACASFSGAVDLTMLQSRSDMSGNPVIQPQLAAVWGPAPGLAEDADLYKLAKKVATLPKEQQPRILCTCGKQDNDPGSFIRDQNIAFHKELSQLPLDYQYWEWDGVHEWNFWDRSFAEFIGFIQNSDYADKKRADWAAPITVV